MVCGRRKIKLLDVPSDGLGIFRERVNRFLGVVDIVEPIEESGVYVHIHDPGRLPEILYPGAWVLLKRAYGKMRKTAWDVLAGKVDDEWVFMHSGYHRMIAQGIFSKGGLSPVGRVVGVKPEVKWKHSRMDFVVQREDGVQVMIEVKGCTLVEDGVALFPDAPTERGRRHMEVLMDAIKSGLSAGVLVLVFRGSARCFSPNADTDPKFAEAFYRAMERGVGIYPVVLGYDGKSVYYTGAISVC